MFDNLVIYKINGSDKPLLINSTTLTAIIAYRGNRSFKEDKKNVRLNKIWRKKCPFLSKYWNKFHCWGFDSRWIPPSVKIYNGDSLTYTLNFKSTEDALNFRDQMSDYFWKK